jgi:uncharacterized protein YndB with AHSA1/START domain
MFEPTAVVQVTRRFESTAEQIFDAWLDPATARAFLFATPSGQMIRADIDARPGGSFHMVDRRDGDDVAHVGTYLDIDRPRRLAFTFAVPKFSKAVTRVVIEIVPRGAGCELTLTHHDVLSDWADQTRSGWGTLLDRLAAVVDTPVGDRG